MEQLGVPVHGAMAELRTTLSAALLWTALCHPFAWGAFIGPCWG